MVCLPTGTASGSKPTALRRALRLRSLPKPSLFPAAHAPAAPNPPHPRSGDPTPSGCTPELPAASNMGCGASTPKTKDYGTTTAASHKAARTKPGDAKSEFDIGPGYKAVKHLGRGPITAGPFLRPPPPGAPRRHPTPPRVPCRPRRHRRHVALQRLEQRAGCGGQVHQAAAAQGATDQHPARVLGERGGCHQARLLAARCGRSPKPLPQPLPHVAAMPLLPPRGKPWTARCALPCRWVTAACSLPLEWPEQAQLPCQHPAAKAVVKGLSPLQQLPGGERVA